MNEFRVSINRYSSYCFKKKIKNLFEKAYDEPTRFMKCFIKEFQNKNLFVQQFKLNDVEHVDNRRKRANN